jgi:hypothetical protein
MCGGYEPPHWRQIRSACWGMGRCVFDTKPLGCESGEVANGMLKPQRPQNFEFCGRGVEHRGQGNSAELSAGLTTTKDLFPQRPQNLTPSAKRELQVEQATIPGITLEWIPPLLLPCDGEG